MKIGINPGHDTGDHVGAVNPGKKLYEGNLCREIGLLLQSLLEMAGHNVVFIQQDNLCGEPPYCDYHNSVVGVLNSAKTDLNISLHCNAWGGDDEAASGTESYYYSTNEEGMGVAAIIQTELVRLGFDNRGVKHGNHLAFCRDTKATSVLVEIGFIRNSHDAEILINKKKEIAYGIAKAIKEYYGGIL